MKKILANIYLVLAILAIVGCTNDSITNSTPIDNGDVNVSISLNLPESFKTITRSATSAIVQKPLVLLLSDDKFYAMAEVEDLNNSTSYKAIMDYETSLKVNKFIVLANYQVDEQDYTPTKGATIEELKDGFKFTAPVDINKGLPMYGEASYDRSISSININLERAVASIEVKLGNRVEGFNLEQIYVGNYNEFGYFIKNTGKSASFENRIQSSKAFSAVENNQQEEIYISEVDMSKLKEDENPTVIILKGVYNGEEGYYRVDFLENRELQKYYSIERNYRYEFTITSIKGVGWNTLESAIANKASNNIEYTLLPWIADMTQMWEQDGKYLAVSGKEILFSSLTTRFSPERYTCQTNIDPKEFVFESDDNLFTCDVTRDRIKRDIVYVDFYPTKSIYENELENVNKFNGLLTVKNAAFKVDLQFKRHKDYLEVHDIDANLFGKYVIGTEVNPETDYIDIKVEYKVNKPITIKIRTGEVDGSETDTFGFEGLLELDPTETTAKARLTAYGKPDWSGSKQVDINFGSLHKYSPIARFIMDIYVLKEKEHRLVKVLFITKNGGDNGGIYSLITDNKLFGKDGEYINTSGDLEISYMKNFPYDKYMDYHIIYYFDSATPFNPSSTIGEKQKDIIEGSSAYQEFTNAVKKFVKAGKAFIYCSDARTETTLGENISWQTIHESSVFLEKATGTQFKIPVSWATNTPATGSLDSRNMYRNMATDGSIQASNTSEMALNADWETVATLYVDVPTVQSRAFLVPTWSVVIKPPLTISGKHKPIVLSPKFRDSQEQPINITWLGTPRIYATAAWTNRDKGEINLKGHEFCELISKAANEADRWDKDYNKPNKKKDFVEVDNQDDSPITKHAIYIHYN